MTSHPALLIAPENRTLKQRAELALYDAPIYATTEYEKTMAAIIRDLLEFFPKEAIK